MYSCNWTGDFCCAQPIFHSLLSISLRKILLSLTVIPDHFSTFLTCANIGVEKKVEVNSSAGRSRNFWTSRQWEHNWKHMFCSSLACNQDWRVGLRYYWWCSLPAAVIITVSSKIQYYYYTITYCITTLPLFSCIGYVHKEHVLQGWANPDHCWSSQAWCYKVSRKTLKPLLGALWYLGYIKGTYNHLLSTY